MKTTLSSISMFSLLVALFAAALGAPARAALFPVVNESGMIRLSVDGVGTNSGIEIVQVEKPSAGATVRRASFACANVGFFGDTIEDGEILLDGAPISWDTETFNFGASFHNVLADVTALIAPKLAASAAGRVDFTVEELWTFDVDGCILAVVFDDPSQVHEQTAILLFGGQEPLGDEFQILLDEPIDLDAPNLVLDFGLGISFGAQDQFGSGGSHFCGVDSPMFSTIDVNGSRLTSCAGNMDDGVDSVENGILLTVGGLDDLNDNPADPFQEAADGQVPRVEDDELYSLIPVVSDGSTEISVTTINPSVDDNIFFAHLLISGQGEVFGVTIFNDGFETGDTSRWSITNGVMATETSAMPPITGATPVGAAPVTDR
jgi:hypothetical protein